MLHAAYWEALFQQSVQDWVSLFSEKQWFYLSYLNAVGPRSHLKIPSCFVSS